MVRVWDYRQVAIIMGKGLGGVDVAFFYFFGVPQFREI